MLLLLLCLLLLLFVPSLCCAKPFHLAGYCSSIDASPCTQREARSAARKSSSQNVRSTFGIRSVGHSLLLLLLHCACAALPIGCTAT
jgi:hypothetical protein